ncbi:hypothetical protein WBG78_21790 [Chryseolinea sp. T2]|uniref:hypothetical protein n=1 Tax=Chryseolinea sp. T2 TaxID=3129255 RepID=UPI0030786E2D
MNKFRFIVCNVQSALFATTYTAGLMVIILCIMTSCEAEEPTREDSPEMVTTVTLTFTPQDGSEPVVGTAVDPDAEGIRDIETDGPIELKAGTTYMLTLGMYNDLADKDSDEYDISAEVEAEGDEHMIFFGWTGNLFTNPSGDGNIDSRNDPIQYEDEDVNGLPLGLNTIWTTGTPTSGSFRILLKHQPELKSATSTSDMGESDLNVMFEIRIK